MKMNDICWVLGPSETQAGLWDRLFLGYRKPQRCGFRVRLSLYSQVELWVLRAGYLRSSNRFWVST